jgi:predicted PurR-regulated permease PerM
MAPGPISNGVAWQLALIWLALAMFLACVIGLRTFVLALAVGVLVVIVTTPVIEWIASQRLARPNGRRNRMTSQKWRGRSKVPVEMP